MRISSVRSHVDMTLMDQIVDRNKLVLMNHSESIYCGYCPLCGSKDFILNKEKATFRCFICGCDGRFVRTPERELQIKKLKMQIESEG